MLGVPYLVRCHVYLAIPDVLEEARALDGPQEHPAVPEAVQPKCPEGAQEVDGHTLAVGHSKVLGRGIGLESFIHSVSVFVGHVSGE